MRELPDGDVSFELDEGSSKLTVKSKSGRYSLSTIPGADFPEFDSVKSENIFSIKSSQLLELSKNIICYGQSRLEALFKWMFI